MQLGNFVILKIEKLKIQLAHSKRLEEKKSAKKSVSQITKLQNFPITKFL